jgi:hypothetical protein
MTKIKWRFDLPDAAISTFNLAESKSWKGKMIRGHDIAEMIADEVWETEAIALRRLHIIGPSPYTGTYDVTPVFEPTFSAKRSADCSSEK